MSDRALLDALQGLVAFAIPCRVCGEPATRALKGQLATSSHTQSAEVVICDKCTVPTTGVFHRYSWFPPFDLDHAPALRRALQLLAEAK